MPIHRRWRRPGQSDVAIICWRLYDARLQVVPLSRVRRLRTSRLGRARPRSMSGCETGPPRGRRSACPPTLSGDASEDADRVRRLPARSGRHRTRRLSTRGTTPQERRFREDQWIASVRQPSRSERPLGSCSTTSPGEDLRLSTPITRCLKTSIAPSLPGRSRSGPRRAQRARVLSQRQSLVADRLPIQHLPRPRFCNRKMPAPHRPG